MKNKRILLVPSILLGALYYLSITVMGTMIPVTSVYAGYVCQNTASIPGGFFVSNVVRDTDCSGNTAYVTLRATNTSHNACQNPHNTYPIPSGYFKQKVEQVFSTCTSSTTSSSSFAIVIIKPTGVGPYEVCSSLGVPAGYVIIEYKDQISTTSTLNCAAMVFRQPFNGVDICDSSPIPPGYVVTQKGSSSKCHVGPGAGTGPAKKLNTPSVGLVVCSGSPVPVGFAFTTVANVPACNNQGGYRLVAPQENAILCDPSPLPGGYVKVTSQTYSHCANNGYGFKIKAPVDHLIMCGNGGSSSVPDGFVISEKLNNGDCQSIQYKIRRPASNTTFIACDGSTLPAGFGYTQSGQYGICGVGSASGYGFIVGPIVAGSSYCQSYNFQVPPGMVITGVEQSAACNNNYANKIDFPESGGGTTEVCQGSIVPAGFIISGKGPVTDYSQCGAFGGFTIRIPSNSGDTLACTGSPIPDGFGFGLTLTHPQCGVGSPNSFMVRLITGAGPHSLCENSPVPAGYVITAKNTPPSCSNSGSGTGIVIQLPNDPGTTAICSSSSIPTGYVVVRLGVSGACTTGSGTSPVRFIQLPNSTSATVVCSGSPIPTGYSVVQSFNNVSSCNNGPASAILPGGDGSIAPAEFVNNEPDVSSQDIPAVNFNCSNGSPSGAFVLSGTANSATCSGGVLD